MRVAFTAEAFVDQGAHTHLDAILYLIENGTHEWHIDNPDLIEESLWLRGARASHRLLFEKAATRPTAPKSVGRVHKRVLLVGKHEQPASLSPEKAVQFLQLPLLVLMENRDSDGTFLDAVLAVLAAPEVLRLKQQGDKALRYDSAGGCGELKKLVERAHKASASADLPLRAVVFTDSDGGFPGDISKAAAAIRDTCQGLGVPWFVLGNRAVENYVPDEVIVAWGEEPEHTSARPAIAALLRLTPAQRDHFPFKKGLSFLDKPADSNHPAEEHGLYADRSAEERRLLGKGFGDDFVRVLHASNTDTGRRDACFRSSLTAESLRRRDRRGDLEALVALIEDQL